MCGGISKFSFANEKFGKAIVILSMARQEMLVLKSLYPEKILITAFSDTELISDIQNSISFVYILFLVSYITPG